MTEVPGKVYNGAYAEELKVFCGGKESTQSLSALGDDMGQLGKDLRKMLEAFQMLERSSTRDNNAPKATMRQFVRHASEAAGDMKTTEAERGGTWRRAGAKRVPHNASRWSWPKC